MGTSRYNDYEYARCQMPAGPQQVSYVPGTWREYHFLSVPGEKGEEYRTFHLAVK
jgi:hypothetical protein